MKCNLRKYYIYKYAQSEIIIEEIPIYENDLTKCITCTGTITINYPNGSNYVKDATLTISDYYGYYEFVPPELGRYSVNYDISNGVDFGGGAFTFDVTTTGKELTISKSILYIVILVVAILLFVGLIIIGISIPSKNKSDEMTGYIIAVSNLKYVKIFSLFFAYLLLMLILYFSYIISNAFLEIDFLSNLFRFAFYVLVISLLPLFIVGTYILIANAVKDHQIGDALQQGLRIRG